MMNLDEIQYVLKKVHDIDIGLFDESFLLKSIEKRMQETHCDSMVNYCSTLEKNHDEGKFLLDSLYVHYSSFFRDPLTYALLERMILPELIHKKVAANHKEIRIWSAGCAAGQEAYSVAILLEEQLSSFHPKVKYRIFATDLDETVLSEAQAGLYPASALSHVSLERVQNWFDHQKNCYRIKPTIKHNIDFSVFDLLGDEQTCPPSSIFGDFDLVFCSNVLIYYKPENQDQILEKLTHCFSTSGYLITDDAEQAIVLARHYRAVSPPAAIFQLKSANRERP
jgi:chemotaxis protein methyltransferase CheR